MTYPYVLHESAGSSRSPRRATTPGVSSHADRHEIGHLNPPGDGDSDGDIAEGGVAHPEGTEESDPRGVAGGGGHEGEPDEGREADGEQGGAGEDAKAEEDPFEAGSFFSKVDDKDKGHYKVRDVSRFLLTSMYKRKDRVTRTPGVSLLVGKLEDPPHEEKVISALFDTDRFTEREAFQWWEDNGHRFEDARSLAEKKVRAGVGAPARSWPRGGPGRCPRLLLGRRARGGNSRCKHASTPIVLLDHWTLFPATESPFMLRSLLPPARRLQLRARPLLSDHRPFRLPVQPPRDTSCEYPPSVTSSMDPRGRYCSGQGTCPDPHAKGALLARRKPVGLMETYIADPS